MAMLFYSFICDILNDANAEFKLTNVSMLMNYYNISLRENIQLRGNMFESTKEIFEGKLIFQ